MTPKGDPGAGARGRGCLRAFRVRGVEEERTVTIYLVLPSASAVGEGGEISDRRAGGRRRRGLRSIVPKPVLGSTIDH